MKRRCFTTTATGGVLLIAGCGFRPLYKPDAGSNAGGMMSHIFIPVLPERSGQLLRQALQQRMDGPDSGLKRQFELTPSLAISYESIGIQRDNSTSRIRIDASAPWLLRALSPGRPVLIQGRGRVLDGYNINDQQFFAAELESDSALRRVASTLADQIVQQVAVYFLAQPSVQTREKPA